MNDTPQRLGRRTAARHGRLSAPSPLARLLRVVGIAMACVLVAGVGVGAYMYWDLSSTFAANAQQLDGQEEEPPDIGELVGEKGVDLLLTGLDICVWETRDRYGNRCSSDPADYGEDGRELQAGRNDVNLLVHISPEPRKITAIAFPRDLMIPTPECTDPVNGNVTYASDKKMINAMYSAGGLACVASTIDALTTPYDPELKIDYAATITWDGVIEITDAIGGVEVCVEGTINDPDAGMLYLEEGEYTLQGDRALAFLRSRHGVGDGGDQGRISNQQVYMASLARKLTSSDVLGNPGTMLSLARTVVTNVDPSSQLTPVTLVQIALAAKDVETQDIVFLQYPTFPDPADANRLVPDSDSAAALFAALAANDSVDPTGKYLETPETETPDPGATVEPTDPAAPAPDLLGRTADDTSCSQANN
ncbi:LCP family protein [Microbacterium marinilacus]|uniref:LCP family protein n=1 Tax=Microbacterium marinilacus TaxID=415209 RepID=A0ABP7BF78_9MICO|nr:LCP family protein [Microbacterium marinilacus]MBY0689575.1 LCP family protein [Microbacterium marinilacus]